MIESEAVRGRFDAAWAAHLAATEEARATLFPSFARLADAAIACLRAGGKLLFFGNGGSAADAQHIATELTIRFMADRPAIAALALTTDSSALTACGNDLGFEQIFARQIEALGRPGDLAIGISTSGHSPNILKGLEVATARGLVAAGLAGRDGGAMARLADPLVIAPGADTARIQEMHIILGHLLCAEIETALASAR